LWEHKFLDLRLLSRDDPERFSRLFDDRLGIVVFVDPLALLSMQTGGFERRYPSCRIVLLVRGCEPFTSAAREIDNERGHHETRYRATELLLKVEYDLERGTQIFNALDEVALVDVVLFLASVTVPG
jgi:hypothetical protein